MKSATEPTCSICGSTDLPPRNASSENYKRSRGVGYVCRGCKRLMGQRRYYKLRVTYYLELADRADALHRKAVAELAGRRRKVSANPATTASA